MKSILMALLISASAYSADSYEFECKAPNLAYLNKVSFSGIATGAGNTGTITTSEMTFTYAGNEGETVVLSEVEANGFYTQYQADVFGTKVQSFAMNQIDSEDIQMIQINLGLNHELNSTVVMAGGAAFKTKCEVK